MKEHEEGRLTTAELASATNREPKPQEQTHLSGVGGAAMARDEKATPLFADEEGRRFRDRWNDIQTGFVDQPRGAVERADALVAETMHRLAEVFAAERGKLEQQWDRGGDVSTEDLRVALQRYRSFFMRLLAM